MLALPLIALGGVVAILAFFEWVHNEDAMRRRERLPGSRLPMLLAVVVGVVAVAAVVISTFWNTD